MDLPPQTQNNVSKAQDSRAWSSWCERQAVLHCVTHPLPRSSKAATTSCLVTDCPHPQCLAACLGGPSPGLSRGRLSHALGPSVLSPPPFRSPVFGRLPGRRLGEPGREGGVVRVSFSCGGGRLRDSASPGCPLAQEWVARGASWSLEGLPAGWALTRRADPLGWSRQPRAGSGVCWPHGDLSSGNPGRRGSGSRTPGLHLLALPCVGP